MEIAEDLEVRNKYLEALCRRSATTDCNNGERNNLIVIFCV